MKIATFLLKTGPNKGNYKPDQPENHRKERKEGKGARAREKKTPTVFSFYSVDFGGFERQCRRPLTDPYSERPGFHKSRYIHTYILVQEMTLKNGNVF